MASPFRYFRKHQKVFLAIAAVLAMIVFVFADMFTSYMGQSGGQSPNTLVTQWEGGKLTVRELELLRTRRFFISDFLELLKYEGQRRIEAEGGTPSEPTVPQFSLPPNVSPEAVDNQLVSERIFADLAEKAGMVISDDMINHYLTEIGLGRVNDQDIRLALGQMRRFNLRTSEKMLFSGLRELLLGNLYSASLTTSIVGVEPVHRWKDWLNLNDRIALEAILLPAEAFLSEVPEPTDAQLVGFYEQFKNQVGGGIVRVWGIELPSPQPGFREPRKVKLKYLLGDVTAWTDKKLDEVTEEEIADYYERNKRTQFVKFQSELEAASTDQDNLDDLFSEEDTAEAIEDETPAEEAPDAVDTDAEQPTGDDQPAAEESSRVVRDGSIELTAFQDNVQEDETASDESAQDGSAETDADASAQEGPDDLFGNQEEDVEYEPLENVRDEIRRQLATDKAVTELQGVMESAFGELTAVYNRYGGELVSAQGAQRDPPPVPDRLDDLSELAKAKDLIYEETIALSAQELSETVVGKATDAQSRRMNVTQLAFSTLKLYEPSLSVDLDGYWYLVLKVEDSPTRVPMFDEVRDQVAAAWKRSEAAKLALGKAEQLAEKAQGSGQSLAASVGDEPFEVVITDLFSRFSFGSTPAEMQQGPRVSDAPPLTAIGDNFMARVFALEGDEAIALANFDGSNAYVVRVERRERTQEELRAAFLAEVNNSQAVRIMEMIRTQNANRVLMNQVVRRAGLDMQSLQNYLQEVSQQ